MKHSSILKDKKDLINFFKKKGKDFVDLGTGENCSEINDKIKNHFYKDKVTMAHILSGVNATYLYC